MNKNYYKDTASLAFQPLINLTFSPFATLSSRASLHWLESNPVPNQWGAFMHFYGPTRKLLKIGGLDLEVEEFLQMHSPNTKWQQLIDDYSKGDLDTAAQLYLIRLLFYLGFYKDGINLCREIAKGNFSLEDKMWAKYLQELGESVENPINWSPLEFLQEMESSKSGTSPFLLFQILLLFSKFYIRNKADINSSLKCLNEASLLIENSELSSLPLDANLSRSRLDKYKADFYFTVGEVQKAESLLETACCMLDALLVNSEDHSSSSYLYRETKRRVLDRLILHYQQLGNEKKAFQFAKQSISIDPYCSYALLLAGKTGLNIDRDFSVCCFESAAEYGVIERAYAKQALSEIHESSLLVSKDLMNEALDGNVFLMSKETSPLKDRHVSLPIEIRSLGEISDGYSESIHWKQIKANAVYHRSLPFWELKPSQFNSPIFCSAPLEALEVFKNKKEPWFETLYLQRAMPINFREELFFAVSPHAQFGIKHQLRAKKLEVIKSCSETADWLISTYSTVGIFSKLEKILFSRLLGSMGFYEEALSSRP